MQRSGKLVFTSIHFTSFNKCIMYLSGKIEFIHAECIEGIESIVVTIYTIDNDILLTMSYAS